MRTFYHIRMPSGVRPAVGDVSEIGTSLYEINRINVPEPFRGKGYGTRILQDIIRDADREGITLTLSVFSSGKQLDNDDLIAWYGRHGFKMLSYANRLMHRRPGGKTPPYEERFDQTHLRLVEC
jgi:GNAT superfamily N-acetyltransferase